MAPADGEILVALDLGSPAIAGTVRVADHPATRFDGWLGLMSVLRTAAEAVGAGGKLDDGVEGDPSPAGRTQPSRDGSAA